MTGVGWSKLLGKLYGEFIDEWNQRHFCTKKRNRLGITVADKLSWWLQALCYNYSRCLFCDKRMKSFGPLFCGKVPKKIHFHTSKHQKALWLIAFHIARKTQTGSFCFRHFDRPFEPIFACHQLESQWVFQLLVELFDFIHFSLAASSQNDLARTDTDIQKS